MTGIIQLILSPFQWLNRQRKMLFDAVEVLDKINDLENNLAKLRTDVLQFQIEWNEEFSDKLDKLNKRLSVRIKRDVVTADQPIPPPQTPNMVTRLRGRDALLARAQARRQIKWESAQECEQPQAK